MSSKEEKVNELASNFGLTPADLNLDLGPLGNLLEKIDIHICTEISSGHSSPRTCYIP